MEHCKGTVVVPLAMVALLVAIESEAWMANWEEMHLVVKHVENKE
jgi:hypothetical protein